MSSIDVDHYKEYGREDLTYRLPTKLFSREGPKPREPERPERLPQIVLKDVTGRKLDTFTHLQEAIYRARQNIRQTREALTAEEWRLPHAPPPARPDYSRAAPPIAKTRERLRGDLNHLSRTTKTSSTRIVEVDVDDVAFVAQSLNHLPNMPSLSFLRQEILAEPKNYFQIVQTMLLHKRFMKQTDKRDAIYNFPGFCSGCRRAGLCYGCEQSLIPHYHRDRLMKTGGGFTYFKKYEPEHQIPGRNPLNWKIQFPEMTLKSVMEAHEKGELTSLEDIHSIEHDENCLLKAIVDEGLPQITGMDQNGFLPIEILPSRESDNKIEDEGIVADSKSFDGRFSKKDHKSAQMSRTSGQGSEHSGDGYHGNDINGFQNFEGQGQRSATYPRIVDLRQQEADEDAQSYDEHFIRDSIDRASAGTRDLEDWDQTQDIENEGSRKTDEGEQENKSQEMVTDEENLSGTHQSRLRSRTQSTLESKHGQGRQLLTRTTNRTDGSEKTKSSSPYSRKYDRFYQDSDNEELYRPPPAFKIRKSERRKIKALSPFSSKRDYNLDLNRKFELKKSDKKATQFKEFGHKGGDWKAPPKFELKKNERDDLKFWKPPQKKDNDDHKKRRPRRTQPTSPDSGLDSEKMHAMRERSDISVGGDSHTLATTSTGSGRPRVVKSSAGSRITRPCTQDSVSKPKTSLFSGIRQLSTIDQEDTFDRLTDNEDNNLPLDSEDKPSHLKIRGNLRKHVFSVKKEDTPSSSKVKGHSMVKLPNTKINPTIASEDVGIKQSESIKTSEDIISNNHDGDDIPSMSVSLGSPGNRQYHLEPNQNYPYDENIEDRTVVKTCSDENDNMESNHIEDGTFSEWSESDLDLNSSDGDLDTDLETESENDDQTSWLSPRKLVKSNDSYNQSSSNLLDKAHYAGNKTELKFALDLQISDTENEDISDQKRTEINLSDESTDTLSYHMNETELSDEELQILVRSPYTSTPLQTRATDTSLTLTPREVRILTSDPDSTLSVDDIKLDFTSGSDHIFNDGPMKAEVSDEREVDINASRKTSIRSQDGELTLNVTDTLLSQTSSNQVNTPKLVTKKKKNVKFQLPELDEPSGKLLSMVKKKEKKSKKVADRIGQQLDVSLVNDNVDALNEMDKDKRPKNDLKDSGFIDETQSPRLQQKESQLLKECTKLKRKKRSKSGLRTKPVQEIDTVLTKERNDEVIQTTYRNDRSPDVAEMEDQESRKDDAFNPATQYALDDGSYNEMDINEFEDEIYIVERENKISSSSDGIVTPLHSKQNRISFPRVVPFKPKNDIVSPLYRKQPGTHLSSSNTSSPSLGGTATPLNSSCSEVYHSPGGASNSPPGGTTMPLYYRTPEIYLSPSRESYSHLQGNATPFNPRHSREQIEYDSFEKPGLSSVGFSDGSSEGKEAKEFNSIYNEHKRHKRRRRKRKDNKKGRRINDCSIDERSKRQYVRDLMENTFEDQENESSRDEMGGDEESFENDSENEKLKLPSIEVEMQRKLKRSKGQKVKEVEDENVIYKRVSTSSRDHQSSNVLDCLKDGKNEISSDENDIEETFEIDVSLKGPVLETQKQVDKNKTKKSNKLPQIQPKAKHRREGLVNEYQESPYDKRDKKDKGHGNLKLPNLVAAKEDKRKRLAKDDLNELPYILPEKQANNDIIDPVKKIRMKQRHIKHGKSHDFAKDIGLHFSETEGKTFENLDIIDNKTTEHEELNKSKSSKLKKNDVLKDERSLNALNDEARREIKSNPIRTRNQVHEETDGQTEPEFVLDSSDIDQTINEEQTHENASERNIKRENVLPTIGSSKSRSDPLDSLVFDKQVSGGKGSRKTKNNTEKYIDEWSLESPEAGSVTEDLGSMVESVTQDQFQTKDKSWQQKKPEKSIVKTSTNLKNEPKLLKEHMPKKLKRKKDRNNTSKLKQNHKMSTNDDSKEKGENPMYETFTEREDSDYLEDENALYSEKAEFDGTLSSACSHNSHVEPHNDSKSENMEDVGQEKEMSEKDYFSEHTAGQGITEEENKDNLIECILKDVQMQAINAESEHSDNDNVIDNTDISVEIAEHRQNTVKEFQFDSLPQHKKATYIRKPTKFKHGINPKIKNKKTSRKDLEKKERPNKSLAINDSDYKIEEEGKKKIVNDSVIKNEGGKEKEGVKPNFSHTRFDLDIDLDPNERTLPHRNSFSQKKLSAGNVTLPKKGLGSRPMTSKRTLMFPPKSRVTAPDGHPMQRLQSRHSVVSPVEKVNKQEETDYEDDIEPKSYLEDHERSTSVHNHLGNHDGDTDTEKSSHRSKTTIKVQIPEASIDYDSTSDDSLPPFDLDTYPSLTSMEPDLELDMENIDDYNPRLKLRRRKKKKNLFEDENANDGKEEDDFKAKYVENIDGDEGAIIGGSDGEEKLAISRRSGTKGKEKGSRRHYDRDRHKTDGISSEKGRRSRKKKEEEGNVGDLNRREDIDADIGKNVDENQQDNDYRIKDMDGRKIRRRSRRRKDDDEGSHQLRKDKRFKERYRHRVNAEKGRVDEENKITQESHDDQYDNNRDMTLRAKLRDNDYTDEDFDEYPLLDDYDHLSDEITNKAETIKYQGHHEDDEMIDASYSSSSRQLRERKMMIENRDESMEKMKDENRSDEIDENFKDELEYLDELKKKRRSRKEDKDERTHIDEANEEKDGRRLRFRGQRRHKDNTLDENVEEKHQHSRHRRKANDDSNIEEKEGVNVDESHKHMRRHRKKVVNDIEEQNVNESSHRRRHRRKREGRDRSSSKDDGSLNRDEIDERSRRSSRGGHKRGSKNEREKGLNHRTQKALMMYMMGDETEKENLSDEMGDEIGDEKDEKDDVIQVGDVGKELVDKRKNELLENGLVHSPLNIVNAHKGTSEHVDEKVEGSFIHEEILDKAETSPISSSDEKEFENEEDYANHLGSNDVNIRFTMGKKRRRKPKLTKENAIVERYDGAEYSDNGNVDDDLIGDEDQTQTVDYEAEINVVDLDPMAETLDNVETEKEISVKKGSKKGKGKGPLKRKIVKKKKAVKKGDAITEENEDIDFDKLPSIHETLSKLLPKGKLHLLNDVKGEEFVKEFDKNEDENLKEKQLPSSGETLTRPRSASPGLLKVSRRLRRTSSLPNIEEFDKQTTPDFDFQKVDFPAIKEKVVPCSICGLKNPETNHMCLPKFKNRFKPKKTKDPNKRIRHGGIGVREPKIVDQSDVQTLVTMVTDSVSENSSVKSTQDSGKDNKDKMEERVLTPSSQRISTPPDSPARTPTPEFTVGRARSYEPVRTPSPVVEKPKRVIQKKQFIKREERKLPTPIPRSCTPQTPVPQEREPETAVKSPEVEEEEPPIKLPELVRLDTPPLPEIVEQKREQKQKVDTRTAILPVPKLKEPLKSPTPKKKRPNMPRSTHKRKRQPAEAPVTTEEVRQMQDTLDFLAKYCIVSKDRLPFYERIYSNIIDCQPMKYDREPILSPRTGMPISKDEQGGHEMVWEKHQEQLNKLHDMVTISQGHDDFRPGMNLPEQELEKISYILEILDKKQHQITDDLHELQNKKLSQIAEMAKKMIPEISRVNYQPKVSKKGKKKKKKKKGKISDEDDDEDPPQVPLRPEDITDEVIAMRLDEATYKKICKRGDIPQIELEMQRCGEKLADIDDRLMELEGQRNLITLLCMEVFFNEQNDNKKPVEFRRQQSALYKHLHPDPDIEMNIEELEGALQVVNHNLISESEFDYLYHILNLPGRRKINFQLFTIIAALSEKISQMDPVIKKLLIKDNLEETKKKRKSYEALDLKMETSKELFALLADGDYETNNNGNAKASQLAVELAAGGLDPEHVAYVLSKFNRYGTGYIDFLDFVTYVPLFIEIHQKIVDDPFNVSLDV